MKILITGATGLVGSQIVKNLTEKGYEIHILTRQNRENSQKIKYFKWDDYNLLPPKEAFDNISGIINLMGENIGDKRWTEIQKKKIYESRVFSTKNIVKVVNDLKIKDIFFISASAIGIYPKNVKYIIDEDSSLDKDNFLSNVCIDWEHSLVGLDSSIRKVIIRTGVVLSKNGGALKKMLLPFSLGLGGIIGNGMQWMSWIDIEDLVQIYIQSIEDIQVQGIFNIENNQAV